ncbi:MAG: hypothetical protein P9X24_16130 [Candidatus Hatepunaea meridiana]|nr:hypothetical protein [Candidatus Hatepunaea meridiana]
MNLVTRLDFDGLLSAAMIYDREHIADISFTSPQTMEEGGLLDILQRGDIIAHLPFHIDAGFWFHNHDASHIDPKSLLSVKGKYGKAPSTARQVFDYYQSPALKRYELLVQVADKIGTANYTRDEVLEPKGWIMVSYTLDPRFSHDESYGMLILNSIKAGKSAEEILALPPVARRVELYKKDEERYLKVLNDSTKLDGNVIVTDLRGPVGAPRGNRFVVFVRFDQGNVHVRLDSLGGFRTRVSVSKSIFNRTCNINIGALMEEFGGGGMEGAGTCIFGRRVAEERIATVIKKLKA